MESSCANGYSNIEELGSSRISDLKETGIMFEKVFGFFFLILGFYFLYFRKNFVARLESSHRRTPSYLHNERLYAFVSAFLGMISAVLGIYLFLVHPEAFVRISAGLLVLLGLVLVRYYKALGSKYFRYIEQMFSSNIIDRYSRLLVPPIAVGFLIFGILLMLGIIAIGR